VKGLTAAFVAECAIISWRDYNNYKLMPLPADFAGAAVIFGLLGLAPEGASTAVSAFGWAVVLAAFLNLWNPSSPTHLGATQAVKPGMLPATNT
jgi:hypothetical protein